MFSSQTLSSRVKSSSYGRSWGGGELGARSSSHSLSISPNDSCYAFVVRSTIYGLGGGQRGSVQELVDWLHKYFPPQLVAGCRVPIDVPKAGLPNDFVNAFSYVKEHGVYSEEEYPWVAFCQPHPNLPTSELKIYIDGFKCIDDHKLVVEQLKKQPLAGVVVTTKRFFKWGFDDQIYEGPSKEESEEMEREMGKAKQQGKEYATPYHAVTLVGYGGVEGLNEHYLCQNTYGTNWGHHGYFKVRRHAVSNVCYPLNAYTKSKAQTPAEDAMDIDAQTHADPMDIDADEMEIGSLNTVVHL